MALGDPGVNRVTWTTLTTVFIDEKKLSTAALSQTLPARLIEQTMPWSASNRWNASLPY